MKKYYIYLNGQRYMEMPKDYGIKQDVYMNYNSMIERYLKDRGLSGRAVPSTRTIEVLSKIIQDPRFTDIVVKHELTHIKQMQETPNYSLQYARALKQLGYGDSPYEVEARRWSYKYPPLHRIGRFDIDYQKQLEKWQRESPKTFRKLAEEEREKGKYYYKGRRGNET